MQRLTHSVGLALCFGFALASLSVLTPSEALARPRVLQEGEMGLVLGAGADVLALEHYPDLGFNVRFGFLSLGSSNLIGPEIEGGLNIGNLVIGAAFQAGLVHSNPDGFASDTNTGYFSVIPFVEYWLPGEDMAPFIGGQFGPSVVFPDGGDGIVWLDAGVRGGLHFFFGDVSLGPFAQINFRYLSETERAAYEIVIGFSFRGWVGPNDGSGGGGPGAETQPAAQPTWQPTNGGGAGAGGGAAPPPATDPVYDPEAGLE
ncbi:MAG: hypothetical protein SangKO_022820 [Sandaracinaceae bacterium]